MKKVPCYTCLLKAICISKLSNTKPYNEYHSIEVLLDECKYLRIYFDLDDLRIRIRWKRQYFANLFKYFIEAKSDGNILLANFLKVMHQKEKDLPRKQIRVKTPKRKKRNVAM